MSGKEKNKKMYSKDHVLVMFEEIKDQFSVFGEGQQMLSDKVDNLEGKFDNLEGKVDNLEVKVDKMQGDINIMQEDITEIKHRLSEKVDLADFQKLEKRLIKLEKLVLSGR
jgi:peptidoglycan hydrolase CwlO-like protein